MMRFHKDKLAEAKTAGRLRLRRAAWQCRTNRRRGYAAFSMACDHWPSAAAPFILARWLNARWPAA